MLGVRRAARRAGGGQVGERARLAAPGSRLGQLQRGRGAGYLAALAAGSAAIDDVLRCVVEDPRVDRALESRGRYYGELMAHLDAPVHDLDALQTAGLGADREPGPAHLDLGVRGLHDEALIGG